MHPEPTSGLDVHTLDFTAAHRHRPVHGSSPARRPAIPSRSATGSTPTWPPTPCASSTCSGPAARSTRPGRPATAGPAGHLGVPPNTGDTAVPAWTGPDAERLYPGWSEPGRFDVSGGWYDAGDHGKYVTSGALPAWQLLATVELVRAYPAAAPSGLEPALLEESRWQLDWLLRMQVPAGHAYAGLAFHRVHGTEWAPPARLAAPGPGDPGAAPAVDRRRAAPGRRRRPGRPDLRHGRPGVRRPPARRRPTAYAAARDHPDLIAPDDEGAFGGGPYDDDDLSDDFFWAAAELWLTTGEPAYRAAVDASPHRAATPSRWTASTSTGWPARPTSSLGSRPTLVQAARPTGCGAQQRGPALGTSRTRRPALGLGLQRPDPQQPDAAGHRVRPDRRGGPADRDPDRDRLPARPQRPGPELRHRLRHRLQPAPAHPALRPRSSTRRSRRRRPGRWPADRPTRPTPASPTTPGCRSCRRSRPTSTRPRSETTNDVCIRWNAPLVWVATFLTVTA